MGANNIMVDYAAKDRAVLIGRKAKPGAAAILSKACILSVLIFLALGH